MTQMMGPEGCCEVRVVRSDAGEPDCCSIPRRFRTAKEKREALEKYRDELKKELAGVEEGMKNLEAK